MIDIKEHIAFIRSLAEWDTAKISDWAEEHIRNAFDAHATLLFLTLFSAQIVNQMTAPHRDASRGGMWQLQSSRENDSAQRLAHQMICVALNYDIDTLSSLATAAVPKEGSDDEQRFYLSIFTDLCLFTHSVIAGKNMEINDDPDD